MPLNSRMRSQPLQLQTQKSRRSILSTALLAGLIALLPFGSEGGNVRADTTSVPEPLALRYEIRMEGRPIGQETVLVRRDGEQTMVQVNTETNVSILFLDFHYDHQRNETWQGDRLTRMEAQTNDDGTKTALVAEQTQSPDGASAKWRFTVNGTVSERGDDSLPLTLWTSAVIRKDHLFSIIDAQPYEVQVAALGAEPLAMGSRTAEVQHYRITGDVTRDLWFDADGVLVRTAFTRKGYPIEIVRIP